MERKVSDGREAGATTAVGGLGTLFTVRGRECVQVEDGSCAWVDIVCP